jgi:hypothetical protein
MYLALFLTPWILMYALSTIAMNHREHLQKLYGKAPPPFHPAGTMDVPPGTFQPSASREENARRILQALGMDGTHNIPKSAGQDLVIVRQPSGAPVRITYRGAENKASIEKQESRFSFWLERFHRRRGYQHPYALEDAWAVSVDVVIFVMVFWVLSGLWMWWEMKATRVMGALSALGGIALFALFLRTI